MIAPEASAAFVANMEEVLEVYQRPHDPRRPLVCLDSGIVGGYGPNLNRLVLALHFAGLSFFME